VVVLGGSREDRIAELSEGGTMVPFGEQGVVKPLGGHPP